MNGVYEAALEIQQFIELRGWRFCIIGGLAAIRWGRPRATQDVDVSLLTGLGTEEAYVDAILEQFGPRISDARQFALQNRVLLVNAANGVEIDIALAAFPYEERVIERASRFEFTDGVQLVTASAEDLVVLKAFAGRPMDWADVENIAIRQSAQLDWEYILRELEALSEFSEDADLLARVDQVRQRSESPP